MTRAWMRHPRLDALLLAFAVVALFGLTWRHLDALGDTFWYLALGRHILERGALPERDPFTFTAQGAPITAWTPLAYVVMALVDRSFGLLGVLGVATVAVVSAHLLAWLPYARGPARWALFPGVLGLVWLQRDDLCARGQVFADVCFTALLVLLTRVAEGRTLRLHGARRLALHGATVALGAVWINVHQSALVLLLLLPACAAGVATEGAVARERLRELGLTFLLVVLGACVTPYGPRLVVEAAALVLTPVTSDIDLFRSPDFRRPEVLVLLAAATLALGATLRRERAGSRGEAIVMLCLLTASLTGRRYLPWLGFATLASWGRLASEGVFAERLAPYAGALRIAAIPAVALGCAAGLTTQKNPLRDVPVAGVRAIDARGLPARVFNPYHWGGYLLYAWGPSARVFVDGRLYPFAENQVFADARQIESVTSEAGDLLAAYQINTVLAERGSRLDDVLRQTAAWELRFVGPIEVVFVRRARLPVELPTDPPVGVEP